MTVKKTDVSFANRLSLYDVGGKPEANVSWAKIEGLLAKRTRPLSAAGVKAIRVAYDTAKAAAGRNPTLGEVNALLRRGRSSLENERAKGRVNDGYVDAREAGALSPVAKAIYSYVDGVAPAKTGSTASVRATTAQLNKALKTLEGVVGKAFARFKTVADGNYPELIGAMRAAAKASGLPEAARSTLIIATNGKVGRGDNGSVTDGGHSLPTESEVKQALRNALLKLKGADGAQIVDFKKPEKAPVSKRDGVVTDLEALRTPSVQGKAALTFLSYAASL